jgi:uncharacterized membrane protein YfcA
MVEEILFLLVIFLSNIIQALTGFAGSVLAMPFSLRLVGSDIAKPIITVVALLICAYIAIRYRKDINFKVFWKMLIFVGAGFLSGFGLEFLPLDQSFLLRLYGLIVTMIALFFLVSDTQKITLPNWVLYLFLFFGGVLQKLYVSGGPFVVIYAAYVLKDKASFRSTLSLLWVPLNTFMVSQQISQGLFNAKVGILLAISVVLISLSYLLAHLLYKKISVPAFMKLTYVLLFISGFSLL